MKHLLAIEEPSQPSQGGPSSRFALWQLGFRPFYLLASIFAALSIGLWALQFSGLITHAYLSGPVLHAHEMLFGFTLAVIVGFLFTAGRNWTNRRTPTGVYLAALCALWLSARVLVLTSYAWTAAVANITFPLAAAISLGIPFWKARNRRNYFFVGLLALMSPAAAVVHLSQLGVISPPGWMGLQLGLDIVLFILCIMGGRVIPMFTNNGVPGANAVKAPTLEKVALGAILAVAASDLLQLPPYGLAACTAAAGAAHFWRWLLWKPWRTVKVPLVWVLHAAYLWIPLHLFLRSGSELGLVSSSLAAHALTTGAIGGLVIGMMTRTARGHTARALRADGYDVLCYVLVLLASVARVGIPLLSPTHLLPGIQISAVLWSAGFGLFAIRYWPVLTRPRLDGKEG